MPNLVGSASFGHTHAIPPIGFAIEKVSRDHTHRWHRRLRVTQTKTHRWNRRIFIVNGPKQKTHKWIIRNKVLTSKTHIFDSGGRVKKTKRHLYRILIKVAKTRTHKFNLRLAVPKTKTHKWNTIGLIIQTKTHKWTAGGRLLPHPTKTHLWNIKTKTTRTHTHLWNILTPIIVSAELEYYKSSNTANSLGGAIDTNAIIVTNVKQNLFDIVDATESTSGDTEYRCLYVRNNSDRSILENAKVWLHANTPSTSSIVSIGLGTSEIDGVEQTVATEGTAPTDVTFSSTAINLATSLPIGNMIRGQHKAVWLKRVISAGSQAYDSDNFTLAFAGSTIASN